MKKISYPFLITALVLVVLGSLFLSTVSALDSLKIHGNTTHYLFRHLIYIVIGTLAGFIFFKAPLAKLKKSSFILFVLTLIATSAVIIPGLGVRIYGASRWISIGGFTFQPSELLKVTAILVVAAFLSTRPGLVDYQRGRTSLINLAAKGKQNLLSVFLPLLVLVGAISIALILQPDISTLAIIALSLVVIYFAAGTPVWHVFLMGIAGAGAGYILILLKPYRWERLLVFLNPETDPLGIGYQMKQSLIAIGSGGWLGKGIGMSAQKFGFLPLAMSDSIFAILAEETGIIGCAILIMLFLAFLWFGLKIANSATDKFAKLSAIGITFWITFQAFFNITSTIGIFPVSGLPLPFFSYGGSHIIAELIGVGILLNISKNG